MASAFGALLNRAIHARGLSQRGFAAKVGSTGPFISMIVRGQRRVPLERLDAWMRVLELEGVERQEFVVQADLSHCPIRIQRLVAQLRRRVNQQP